MRIAAGELLGEIRDRGELPMFDYAVRDAQPAHIARLRRRDIEEPVIAPAEIVFRFRWVAGERLLAHPLICIQRMLGALPFLLVDELFAIGSKAVLRTGRWAPPPRRPYRLQRPRVRNREDRGLPRPPMQILPASASAPAENPPCGRSSILPDGSAAPAVRGSRAAGRPPSRRPPSGRRRRSCCRSSPTEDSRTCLP